MKLNVEEISKKIRHYSVKESAFSSVTEKDDWFSAGIEVAISRRDEDSFAVEGEFEGSRRVACDRCGELVEQKLVRSFSYLATTRKEEISDLQNVEVREEEVNTLYLQELVIDLGEILQEQADLAVPVKTLCSDDCKGVCPGCGVDLNRRICSCSPGKKDIPFAALEKLSIH